MHLVAALGRTEVGQAGAGHPLMRRVGMSDRRLQPVVREGGHDVDLGAEAATFDLGEDRAAVDDRCPGEFVGRSGIADQPGRAVVGDECHGVSIFMRDELDQSRCHEALLGRRRQCGGICLAKYHPMCRKEGSAGEGVTRRPLRPAARELGSCPDLSPAGQALPKQKAVAASGERLDFHRFCPTVGNGMETAYHSLSAERSRSKEAVPKPSSAGGSQSAARQRCLSSV